jgi:hypothetical protein
MTNDLIDEKPLFVPLNAEFWYAFRNGDKTDELRLFGPRWNEETCRVGRKALLSKGYGKAHRILAVVAEFHKRDARSFGSTTQANILRLFGTLDKPIAQIKFTDFDRSKYPL